MRYALSTISALVMALSACSAGPRPLVAGEDACNYCRMTIDDVRFGAMLRSARGKIETFDSIECLASFVAGASDAARPSEVWVADFEHPTEWIPVATARFVHDGRMHSPMGRSFAAFSPTATVERLALEYGGQSMNWDSVLVLVRADQFAPEHR